MTKIVYCNCYGGFSLSQAAIERYAAIKGKQLTTSNNNDFHMSMHKLNGEHFYDRAIPRDDPALVQVVEELGDKANGSFAHLAIRELPSGTKYRIDEDDGAEIVMTIDDYDWSIA